MLWLIALIVICWVLAYRRIPLPWSTLVLTILLAANILLQGLTPFNSVIGSILAIILIPLNLPRLRRRLISRPVHRLMQNALPVMSRTEREALEAGNTWWDAQLFSGSPDWHILQDMSPARLSDRERAFLDGPVEMLCDMLDDWDITHKRCDLPEQVWDFIKSNKFCGMIIPEQYGGLEFSHFAHSEVVMKLSSRSITAAVTVMVPNSLGPATLLLAYGTERQKDHYLPRLADGREIPCFALTGPQAGSDAGAMPDTGIVCYDSFDGNEHVLGIRLNWEKRYITLGPVATVLGLAFKLYDPDHILGEQEDIGITVALIPANTPGISIGRRHFPLNSAFQNGPNWGKDVFIPMDWVIGGQAQIGNGWKMLMQCLATGRGISLPALSVGGAKFTCRNTGAYARIRKQFNRAISEFEGIEEVLAHIAGETYIVDAARKITAAALDDGQQPAVISAIIKYELTERMRRIINNGMDIQGGSGICLGPNNFLGRLYQVIPVSITVEGANILTRTMMIFGQGAIRCHPFLQKEMAALHDSDRPQALRQFDRLLLEHIGCVIHHIAAAAWFGISGARFVRVPGDRHSKAYYRKIARLSTAFALSADFALLTLGGSLKKKERISGRFADVLSNLYLCSCVLKHYQDQGCLESDLPLMHWACRHTIYRAQQALLAVFWKLPFYPLVWLLRSCIFPTGKPYSPPDDKLIQRTASILLTDTPTRDRLTEGIYVNHDTNDATGRIEAAFKAVLAAAPAENKLRQAQKTQQLPKGDGIELIELALSKAIIDAEQAELLIQAEQLRSAVIQVDDFDPQQLT